MVLETGLAPDRASRPNGIDTVVKYQIRIHNNMSSSDVDVQAQNSRILPEKNARLPGLFLPWHLVVKKRSGDPFRIFFRFFRVVLLHLTCHYVSALKTELVSSLFSAAWFLFAFPKIVETCNFLPELPGFHWCFTMFYHAVQWPHVATG